MKSPELRTRPHDHHISPRSRPHPGAGRRGRTPAARCAPARPRRSGGGTPGAGPRETHGPSAGWAKAPLAVILVVVVLVAALFAVMAVVIAG